MAETKRAIPLGWRLFLWMGVPFGSIMGLLSLGSGEPLLALGAGVVSGLFFGVSMALSMTAYQAWSGRDLSSPTSADLDVNQQRVFVVVGSRDQVLTHARATLATMGISDLSLDDPDIGRLEGTTGMSFRSFGEDVTVTVKARGVGRCEVIVTSKPNLSTTLADGGVNRANVERIEAALTQLAPELEADIELEADLERELARDRARLAAVREPEG